jgi:hypothetical protein
MDYMSEKGAKDFTLSHPQTVVKSRESCDTPPLFKQGGDVRLLRRCDDIQVREDRSRGPKHAW